MLFSTCDRGLVSASRPRNTTQVVALVIAWVTLAAIANPAQAEQVTFNLDPDTSSVDLTAAGFVFGNIATTFDTQTIPLGGTITLEVVESGGVVQSVDFVALEFDYLADPNDPTVFTFTVLAGFPGAGASPQAILPWGTLPPAGNPVTVLDPLLSLDSATGGTESGTGGDLTLTSPVFSFVATGQYQNNPNVPDGFPINFGPYPLGDTFPGAPAGPNKLDGVVSIVGNSYVFNGTFLSIGRGGAGALQTAMVHTGVFTAVTPPACSVFAPADFDQDCDVDFDDANAFVACMTGPAIVLTIGCEDKDLDLDADADLADFANVQRCFSGAGIEADPNCAD